MAHHTRLPVTGGTSLVPPYGRRDRPPNDPAVTVNPLYASVIVPSHRRAHRLPTLLEALAHQDHPGPWEVVVVLDGVLDDSPRCSRRGRTGSRCGCCAPSSPVGGGGPQRRLRCRPGAGADPVRRRPHPRSPDGARPRRDHRGRDDVGVSCAMRDVATDTPYARTYGAATGRRRLEQWYTRPAALRWVDWSAHNSVTRVAWERLDHGFDPRFVARSGGAGVGAATAPGRRHPVRRARHRGGRPRRPAARTGRPVDPHHPEGSELALERRAPEPPGAG